MCVVMMTHVMGKMQDVSRCSEKYGYLGAVDMVDIFIGLHFHMTEQQNIE